MSKPKGFKLVYIQWCDAISKTSGWAGLSECLEWGDSNDWVIDEVGYLLKETKQYLLLANKVSHHSSDEPLFDQVMKIPKTWIFKRKALSILNKPNK